MMDRRTFLKLTGSAALLASTGASPALSQISLGTGTLTTLSDGNLVLPRSMVLGGLPAEVDAILSTAGVEGPNLTPECNLALWEDGDAKVLFDAGSGTGFMPSAGFLIDSLDAAGLYPEDITHVVFTHAHPDHLWGILDDFDDVAFPESKLLMGRVERDYWLDPNTIDTIGQERQSFVAGALRRLELIADRIEVFDDGAVPLPGINAWMTPGHTPGHMAFEVRSGSNSALIVGDALGNHHVSFAHPEWEVGSDQDQAQGAASRARIFDRLKAEDMQIIGFHLPNGGMGRAEAMPEGGYRFVNS